MAARGAVGAHVFLVSSSARRSHEQGLMNVVVSAIHLVLVRFAGLGRNAPRATTNA